MDVSELAQSRIQEIKLLESEIENSKFSGTRRTFQQLPRHMRRRAASHNINRLPKRLRQKAIIEVI